ncbi:MAG TPA: amidohydrolase family protein [Candidatus Dormibacteraeota bacterium]
MIDSHFHIWRRSEALQKGILAAGYLQRDFSFEDLAAAAGPELDAAVEVQVNDFVDGTVEARFVAAVRESERRLAAHIAWARLESPEVAAELDALAEIALVRGVRRTCQVEADPDVCASRDYIRGARLLGERAWLCEICVRLAQIRSVPRLARAAPETAIVLQHIGKPDLTQPPTAEWLRAVEELGALPNVTCKLSVVVHAADDPPYEAERVAPFVRHLVECFGWRRLLFGSNWPVALAVTGYREWVEMLRSLLVECGAGPAELEGVFSSNARRLYRLVQGVSTP